MKTLALLPIATALIGCVHSGPAPTSFAGSSWKVVSLDDAAPVAPEKARISFRDDNLGANAGCNAMGGAYRMEGGQLIAGPLMATRMYCQGPVMAQERALGALLEGRPRVTFANGQLELRTDAHHAVLTEIDGPQG